MRAGSPLLALVLFDSDPDTQAPVALTRDLLHTERVVKCHRELPQSVSPGENRARLRKPVGWETRNAEKGASSSPKLQTNALDAGSRRGLFLLASGKQASDTRGQQRGKRWVALRMRMRLFVQIDGPVPFRHIQLPTQPGDTAAETNETETAGGKSMSFVT